MRATLRIGARRYVLLAAVLILGLSGYALPVQASPAATAAPPRAGAIARTTSRSHGGWQWPAVARARRAVLHAHTLSPLAAPSRQAVTGGTRVLPRIRTTQQVVSVPIARRAPAMAPRRASAARVARAQTAIASPGGPAPAPFRRPAIACPTHVWTGLPYLNRFFDESLQNGVCTPGPTYIGGNTFGTLSGSAGAAYFQEADVIITGTLTLAAGTLLLETGGSHLYINGAFNANGTAQAPIFIIAALPGAWQGLVFGVGSTGTLEDVTVGEAATGITVDNSSPTIDHSAIEYGTGDGIRINDDGTDAPPAPTLTDDTFTGNSGDAVHVVNTVPQVPWTVSALSASGNGYDGIVVDGGTVLSGHTWSMATDPGVPLYVGSGITVQGGATLSLANWRAIQLNDFSTTSAQIEAQGGGTLDLAGTATVPISVTAVGNAQALGRQPCWRGIRYDDGSSGAISFAHLSNGGCGGYPGTIEVANSSPALTNLTIDQGSADGIFVEANNLPTLNPTIANVMFTGDAGVAVEWRDNAPQVRWGLSGLQGSGNGCNCIQVDGGIRVPFGVLVAVLVAVGQGSTSA